MSSSDFDPKKGEFGIGNGINEYNDQEAQAKATTKGAAAPAGDVDDGANDPVAEMNAPEAVESIARMRSKDKLQQIIGTDQRATVKSAAQKRLAELG